MSCDTFQDVLGGLTNDHQDKNECGHSSSDVEHNADVVCQLIHIVHIGHQDGWQQEANGNAHLWMRRKAEKI